MLSFLIQCQVLSEPPKDMNLPQSAFLNINHAFSSGKLGGIHCLVQALLQTLAKIWCHHL